MDTLLVTGGTGHLGRDLVSVLKDRYRVRVLARKPGQDPAVEWVEGDLGTGEGVAEAVAGAQSVVHAATFSPSARRGFLLPSDFFRSPSAVDVDGTSRLIDAAEEAGIEHFLYVSIVGVERTPLPYARLKLIAETLVRRSALPWSVVRATPFYWLVDRMLGNMMRLPVLPLPVDLATQPCDTRDFARYLAECLADGPGADQADFGGPQVLSLGEIVNQYQDARGMHRPVRPVPLPKAAARVADALVTRNGRRGQTTWSTWLSRQVGAPNLGEQS
jgi:uncharacterized protein YbjT (DUF2867 family)